MRVPMLPLLVSSLASLLPAQVPGSDGAVDEEAVKFFLEEGLERSQVMEHLSWLCDVYGPRVTGSPNLRKAQAWSSARFRKTGMKPTLEEWGPFGRGWRCEHVAMSVVGDNPWPVIAYAKAWSPGVDGRVEADVVHAAALSAEGLRKADLKGKVVLIADMRPVREPFDGVSKRHDTESLLRLADQRRAETQRSGDRARSARSRNSFRMGFQKRMQMMAIVQEKEPLALDNTGGTDHLAFHGVGVPGFQFIQDEVSYNTRTHHSNMDNWDHAVADDLKQASVIMATFVWQTAQRDGMLPRIGGGGR